MTDDDTKFERAQRERPHIEAFARITDRPPVEQAPHVLQQRETWEEMLARWSDVDAEHGTS